MDITTIISNLGIWNILLLILLPTMGTAMSYIPHAKWKAFIAVIPVPFTLITLSIGTFKGVDSALGVIILLAYIFSVKFFYQKLHIPIVLSILLAVIEYCILAYILKILVPNTVPMIIIFTSIYFSLSVWIHLKMPYKEEPHYRSPLAVWKKFLILLLLAIFAIIMKNYLGGFMSVFPLFSIIGAYESRSSLYTFCRYISLAMIGFGFLLSTMYILQDDYGLIPALIAGLSIYIPLFSIMLLAMWKKDGKIKLINNNILTKTGSTI